MGVSAVSTRSFSPGPLALHDLHALHDEALGRTGETGPHGAHARSASERLRSCTCASRRNAAAIDDDHALAELLDVARVVGGEEDGHPFLLVGRPGEFPDLLLGDHVQADGGFVEEDHLRLVDQGGRDLAAHALPQGELAHGRLHELLQLEELHQLPHPSPVPSIGHLVDPREKAEAVHRGQMHPELALLAEDGADAEGEASSLGPGNVAENAGAPRAGVEDAREHLDGRALPGPVGSDEGEQLPAFHGEAHVPHRLDLHGLGSPQTLQAAEESP